MVEHEPRSYPTLDLAGAVEEVEAALALLVDAGCLGTEEIQAGRGERAYFPPGTRLEALARGLARTFPNLRLARTRPVPDQDWLALWRQGFRGFPVGERFYILPLWIAPPATERLVLRIDPERAFGTGTHETTRLCLELIERRARAGVGAIDAGAGTAVLAMAAAALGSRPVTAIEVDPEAAACARANVERNGLRDRVQVIAARLDEVAIEPADLVVANLSEPVLKEELPRLGAWVRPGGVLIVSGLLLDESQEILEQARAAFALEERPTAGEWAALLLRKDD